MTHPTYLGGVPSLDDVKDAFKNHLENYSTSRGEQAQVLRNSEASVKLQYSGRVAFELLQNALDRAEKDVWIALLDNDEGSTLVVANDGAPVTLDPAFNYDRPPSRDRRTDLNALMSLHTSNKSADKSMGNKGIGFRSVFGIGERVQVWSRCRDNAGWWGVEMHWPARKDIWLRRAGEYAPACTAVQYCWGDLAPEVVTKLDEAERASFALPLPLRANDPPEVLAEALISSPNLVTAVIVPVRPDVREDVVSHLKELRGSRLHFVGLRLSRSIQVSVVLGQERGVLHTWPVAQEAQNWWVLHWNSKDLLQLARDAEHQVSEPGVALAWPPRRDIGGTVDGESRASRAYETFVFNYLPTRLRSDLDADLHGDFQVKADRTSMDLSDNVVGRYNWELIKAAADLHLWGVLTCLEAQNDTAVVKRSWSIVRACPAVGLPSLPFRDDLWSLLTPRDGGFGALSVALIELLFDRSRKPYEQECYAPWAELARAFFRHSEALGEDSQKSLPCQVYREFWDVSSAWLERLTGCGSHTSTWQKAAIALCKALRELKVPCLPLASSIDIQPTEQLRAVPLPERLEKGGQERSGSRVFLRRTEQRAIPLPAALLKNDRAITAFPLNQFDQPSRPDFRPTGVVEFGRWEVLAELRQLPNDVQKFSKEPLDADANEAAKRQRELIRLAADLFTIQLGTNQQSPSEQLETFGLAWRASSLPDESRGRAGRAVATLFLPTMEGLWAPARQLHRGQVNVDAIGLPEELNVEAFLTFLGVALVPPNGSPPILLVEKGTDGLVSPLELPPILCAAGSGDKVGEVDLALDQKTLDCPQRLAVSILAAWQKGLSQLVRAESNPTSNEGNKAGTKTAIADRLRSMAWVPVDPGGWIIAPGGSKGVVHAVRPEQVVTQHGRDRRAGVTYRLRVDDEQIRQLLEALGAVPALTADHLQHGQAALVILETLHASYPELSQLPPDRLRNLLDLAQEAIDALMRHSSVVSKHPPIPVHGASGKPEPLDARPVYWVDNPQIDAWIATDNAQQEIVRRFFPSLPLASVTIGPKVIENNPSLKPRAVRAREDVKGGERLKADDSLAGSLAERIFKALPGLLALAQASRIMTPNVEEVRKRWGNTLTGPLVHVEDAWIEIALEGGPSVEPVAFLKGTYGDVLLLDNPGASPGDDSRGIAKILFDTAQDGTESPQLADFGNALAEGLLNNKALGPLFSRALATLEPEGIAGAAWHRLIEREGAEPLVAGYKSALMPLTSADEGRFKARVVESLATAGARLNDPDATIDQLRRLRKEDLLPLDGGHWSQDITARTITEKLNAATWEDRERPFIPVLSVEADNALEWKSWLGEDGWGRRLDVFALHQIRCHGHPDEQLQDLQARRQQWLEQHVFMRMMDLSCLAIASEWLREVLAGASELTLDIAPDRIKDTLRTFAPRFQPVTGLKTVAAVGWSAPQTTLSGPSKAEITPGTRDDYDRANAIKSAIGDEAERALLPFIAKQTHNVLQNAQHVGDDEVKIAWETLMAAAPSSGKTHQALETAHSKWRANPKPECLEEALHVSRIWGNAGFDFLGLEEKDGAPVAVRYETKGLPDGHGPAYIHLSNNERCVANRVCLAKPGNPDDIRYQGDWRLIAVERDGQAIDLTGLVVDLIKRPEDVLGELLAKGMMPDGLLLRLNR